MPCAAALATAAWLAVQKREDMTERDWRIFREDFSISYKGSAMGPNSLPLRNWQEAELPDDLMRAIERQVGLFPVSPLTQEAAVLSRLSAQLLWAAGCCGQSWMTPLSSGGVGKACLMCLSRHACVPWHAWLQALDLPAGTCTCSGLHRWPCNCSLRQVHLPLHSCRSMHCSSQQQACHQPSW